jgi:hypothetical protein
VPHAEVPLLKDRDFLYREVTQKLPNGVILIYGLSLSQEEAQQVEGVPQIKGVIRGEMGASGWVIAPLEGGAHSSVTYVALTDLKVRRMLSRHPVWIVCALLLHVCCPHQPQRDNYGS